MPVRHHRSGMLNSSLRYFTAVAREFERLHLAMPGAVGAKGRPAVAPGRRRETAAVPAPRPSGATGTP